MVAVPLRERLNVVPDYNRVLVVILTLYQRGYPLTVFSVEKAAYF